MLSSRQVQREPAERSKMFRFTLAQMFHCTSLIGFRVFWGKCVRDIFQLFWQCRHLYVMLR